MKSLGLSFIILFILRRKYKTLNLIEINAQSFLDNYSYFQNLHPESRICPVLKSNAYGHGLTLVGKFIDEEIKPEFICVDSLYEAYELEKSGIKNKILIIGYTFPENFKFRKIPFSIPVFDLETIKYLSQYQSGAKVHLKIDTGMNRLGIKEEQFKEFSECLKKHSNIEIEGIYTHLSDAENNDETFSLLQIERFKKAVKFFEDKGFEFKWKHSCSTAGSFRFKNAGSNMIRLGIGFYGISPFSDDSPFDKKLSCNLKSCLRFVSHVSQIKIINKGETVSYNRTFKSSKRTKIAILPLGYYDGFDRRLSNIGKVTIAGASCPILGRVCMNVSVVDVSNVKNPHVGQEVVIYDNMTDSENSIKNIARKIDTIPYELLVKLSETTRRELKEKFS